MKQKIIPVLCAVVFLIFAGMVLTFAQGTPAEQEMQWLLGEVSSVDIQKNELTVLCLDYDTGEEREIIVSVDNKTVYESVNSLLDIKPPDAVGIDYLISPDGKNIAKIISVEIPDKIPEVTADQ